MGKQDQDKQGRPSADDPMGRAAALKQQRRAEALRANLQRRKSQARARQDSVLSDDGAADADPSSL